MERTLRFRKQHEEIMLLTGEISRLLSLEQLSKDCKSVRSLLAKLAGLLNMHLAAEDNGLYPRLLKDTNKDISTMAERYIEEMSGLKESFEKYLKKWPSSITIKNNPEQFITDTSQIFTILKKRIEKENNELYYIIDRLN